MLLDRRFILSASESAPPATFIMSSLFSLGLQRTLPLLCHFHSLIATSSLLQHQQQRSQQPCLVNRNLPRSVLTANRPTLSSLPLRSTHLGPPSSSTPPASSAHTSNKTPDMTVPQKCPLGACSSPVLHPLRRWAPHPRQRRLHRISSPRPGQEPGALPRPDVTARRTARSQPSASAAGAANRPVQAEKCGMCCAS